MNFPRREAVLLGYGWVDWTVPFLLSVGLVQTVERVLAVAFGNKLCWFHMAVSYFPTLYHKRLDFREKLIQRKTRALIFFI
jgi:hypothetical protein